MRWISFNPFFWQLIVVFVPFCHCFAVEKYTRWLSAYCKRQYESYAQYAVFLRVQVEYNMTIAESPNVKKGNLHRLFRKSR